MCCDTNPSWPDTADGVSAKAGEVKAHPRTATLHVCLERGALRRILGARIEKDDDLVS